MKFCRCMAHVTGIDKRNCPLSAPALAPPRLPRSTHRASRSTHADPLRGADAETYGNARRKIEATVAEVGAARAALRGTLAALDAYEATIPR